MPRMPKSTTSTPGGYGFVFRLCKRCATSTPKASSPRKILPMQAMSIRFGGSCDGRFMAFSVIDPNSPVMYSDYLLVHLHLTVSGLAYILSLWGWQEYCPCTARL